MSIKLFRLFLLFLISIFAMGQSNSLYSISKLVGCPMREVLKSLDFENQVLDFYSENPGNDCYFSFCDQVGNILVLQVQGFKCELPPRDYPLGKEDQRSFLQKIQQLANRAMDFAVSDIRLIQKGNSAQSIGAIGLETHQLFSKTIRNKLASFCQVKDPYYGVVYNQFKTDDGVYISVLNERSFLEPTIEGQDLENFLKSDSKLKYIIYYIGKLEYENLCDNLVSTLPLQIVLNENFNKNYRD